MQTIKRWMQQDEKLLHQLEENIYPEIKKEAKRVGATT